MNLFWNLLLDKKFLRRDPLTCLVRRTCLLIRGFKLVWSQFLVGQGLFTLEGRPEYKWTCLNCFCKKGTTDTKKNPWDLWQFFHTNWFTTHGILITMEIYSNRFWANLASKVTLLVWWNFYLFRLKLYAIVTLEENGSSITSIIFIMNILKKFQSEQNQRSNNLMTLCIDGLRKFGPVLLT